MKTIKLVFVSTDNHNKFYDMTENTDGTFTAKWGRIGATSSEQTYPIKRWDSIYREKVKKGYVDQTHLFIKQTPTTTLTDISDSQINALVALLQGFANKSIDSNYTVDASSVTQAQIDAAQAIIDSLSKTVNKKSLEAEEINNELVKLYSIIPRRMGHVQDHICDKGAETKDTRIQLKEYLTVEQDTLDVMASQVTSNTLQTTAVDHKNILELMDIELETVPPTDSAYKLVQKMMGNEAKRLEAVYRVCMHKTEKPYTKYLESAKNKITQLYWHGSRNENWWSILNSGLQIRPSNAVITGKMFGYGIYGADQFNKSYGYTSGSGARWTGGGHAVAILGLFEYHMGNSLATKKYESWHQSLTFKKLRELGDYDSLSAYASPGFLYNNEFIVYQEQQLTAKYLIKVKA